MRTLKACALSYGKHGFCRQPCRLAPSSGPKYTKEGSYCLKRFLQHDIQHLFN